MKKLSKAEAELKKSVAYKKKHVHILFNISKRKGKKTVNFGFLDKSNTKCGGKNSSEKRPKPCENCAFPHNFHTMKIGEILRIVG